MATNSNLQMSRAGKTDEFYTQLATIEEELRHYRKYFKDKIVFCNCDDPYESNFFKYFALNFNVIFFNTSLLILPTLYSFEIFSIFNIYITSMILLYHYFTKRLIFSV